MPIESRSRMVSFRLTIDEYERIRQLGSTRGLNNISEMVRAAVNRLLADPPSAPSPANVLESRVSDLENRLQSLASAIEGLNPRAEPHAYRQAVGSQR